jgi:adenine deaminase
MFCSPQAGRSDRAGVAYTNGSGTRVIDAHGRFITPGLVEGHLHQYHSYLGVTEYVEALLSHGVTATADGFYGPGIVSGVPAVRFFKEAFERMPIRLMFVVPTLAWLQNRELGLTPTPRIEAKDLMEMLSWEGCYGLEEPPYLPVVEHYPEFLDLFGDHLPRPRLIDDVRRRVAIGLRALDTYITGPNQSGGADVQNARNDRS